ncbi:hypothetical protein CHS0354_028034 [Potamilus streckersoni]|uniref:Uncharacterized protein n=1 Tax=Potamilus streckersoni TaxID=2493646 RepID=A0AAE0TIM5_9BIVA|nr:hypothetical protein CHS0354_028034 [Potamilus streckersoni]
MTSVLTELVKTKVTLYVPSQVYKCLYRQKGILLTLLRYTNACIDKREYSCHFSAYTNACTDKREYSCHFSGIQMSVKTKGNTLATSQVYKCLYRQKGILLPLLRYTNASIDKMEYFCHFSGI